MNFYKQVIIIAVIILIISLAVIGTILAKSDSDNAFPPTINACPDFYKLNDNGECKSLKDVYDTNAEGGGCDLIDFTADDYSNPGIGPNSGACAKKTEATRCGITWDGITNNPDICY